MARKPDIDKDRFFAVMGGSLPGLPLGRIVKPLWAPVVRRIPLEWPEGAWPREPHFRVMLDMHCGTLAELKDHYCKGLDRAAQVMFALDTEASASTRELAWGFNEKFQDWLNSLGVNSLTFGHHNGLFAGIQDPELKRRYNFRIKRQPVPCPLPQHELMICEELTGVPEISTLGCINARQMATMLTKYADWLEACEKAGGATMQQVTQVPPSSA